MSPHPIEPEHKIADVVHRLLKEHSIDNTFKFQDNLLDVGLTSLDMTNLILSVEAEFSLRIPDRFITPANFTSVATIGCLVTELMKSSGGILGAPTGPTTPSS
jgi:acyl carrier protein